MDKQQRQKFSPEVRERAVRMVIEHRGNIPPAEAEAAYNAGLEEQAIAA